MESTKVWGYIPKIFAFKNPYALKHEKSDLFYILLICTKQPESRKFQRAVSLSSKLHAIEHIPRYTTTLTFLWIIRQNADSRGMRKFLHKVATVVNFALTV